MSNDFRENGHRHALSREDVAIERLPADLQATYDQLARDSEGWARRLPQAAPLQGYVRALGAGTAKVDTAADIDADINVPPESASAGWRDEVDDEGDLAGGLAGERAGRAATGAWVSATDTTDPRPSRRAVWGGGSAVSALVIVALLAGGFALVPHIRGTNGRTTTAATASPTQGPAICPPNQITLILPAHAFLDQLAVTSPTEGWALGHGPLTAWPVAPLLVHFHQCSWTPVPTPLDGTYADLGSISMASGDEGWAAGERVLGASRRCVLLHYARGVWQPAPLPAAIPTQALQCNCSPVRMLSPREGWLIASWGKGEGDMTSHLFHYVDGTWTLVDGPLPVIGAVAAVGPDDVWVAGMRSEFGGQTIAAHYQHGRWTSFPLPIQGPLTDFRMNTPTDGWLVSVPSGADLAQVLHYDGVAWQATAFSGRVPANGYIQVLAADDAWSITVNAKAAGDPTGPLAKVASMEHFVGGQWQAVPWPFPDDAVFVPLTRVAPSEYWADGIHAYGAAKSTWKSVLLHFVDGTWHEYGAGQ